MRPRGLFLDWPDAESLRPIRSYPEDVIGLALARIDLPPVPSDDPAFARFGLFVADLPRAFADLLRAEERVSLTGMLGRRG